MSTEDQPEQGSGEARDAQRAAPPEAFDDTPTVTRAASNPVPETAPVPPVELAPQFPLADQDPVKVGDFWLDARLTATPAGMAFVAHEDGGDSVMLLLLSEGAARDAAARARFSGEINAMHIDTVVARGGEGQNEGRMAGRFRSEDDDPVLERKAPLAPWVALAFDGSQRAVDEAARILLAIDLTRTPPLSKPSGPDYRLHWIDKTGHGATRVWPLPWPGRRERAGWITMLVAFLLMALIAALALLLAILVFQNQPLVDAPQPIPSPASGSGSGSGSPQSGSPSGGGSPASPSPGDDGGPYSDSPSMVQPSGDQSGPGNPSPNPRL
ncbi:hypothetical protein [Tessaracoccus flavescens]|uniref:hypothetical protein n=1 Tax=Tessaracoccus flavescens TaxID=399497 RepID=UPI0015CFA0BD|nr:hypothetical protein [Tessaracoccus flavescens]